MTDNENQTLVVVKLTTPTPTLSLDDALERIGFGKWQLRLLIITGLLWISDALELLIVTFLSPAAQCEWNLNEGDQVSEPLFISFLSLI